MPAWVKSLWGFGSQQGSAARPSCVLQAAQFQRASYALSRERRRVAAPKAPLAASTPENNKCARAGHVDARQNRREGQPCRPARYNDTAGTGGTLRRRDPPRRAATRCLRPHTRRWLRPGCGASASGPGWPAAARRPCWETSPTRRVPAPSSRAPAQIRADVADALAGRTPRPSRAIRRRCEPRDPIVAAQAQVAARRALDRRARGGARVGPPSTRVKSATRPGALGRGGSPRRRGCDRGAELPGRRGPQRNEGGRRPSA